MIPTLLKPYIPTCIAFFGLDSRHRGQGRKVKLWLAVVGWGILIYLISSIPSLSSGLGVLDVVLRKTAHIVEYAILSLLIYRSLFSGYLLSTKVINWLVTIVCIIYAISDEIHQSYVPGRVGSVIDVCIDFIGVIAGIWIALRMVTFLNVINS